jgi:hypothetical protein
MGQEQQNNTIQHVFFPLSTIKFWGLSSALDSYWRKYPDMPENWLMPQLHKDLS